jgi:hypothetical protein
MIACITLYRTPFSEEVLQWNWKTQQQGHARGSLKILAHFNLICLEIAEAIKLKTQNTSTTQSATSQRMISRQIQENLSLQETCGWVKRGNDYTHFHRATSVFWYQLSLIPASIITWCTGRAGWRTITHSFNYLTLTYSHTWLNSSLNSQWASLLAPQSKWTSCSTWSWVTKPLAWTSIFTGTEFFNPKAVLDHELQSLWPGQTQTLPVSLNSP